MKMRRFRTINRMVQSWADGPCAVRKPVRCGSRLRGSLGALTRQVFVFALTCLSQIAVAQTWTDPTRPPSASAVPDAPKPSGPVFQSVILPRSPQDGKPVAIISGEPVSIGGRVGDATVVRITETEITLKGPEGIQTLRMTPDVDKRPVARSSGRGHQ